MARTAPRAYRRQDVEEFDRKLRRFHESLAQKERRMLRDMIISALEEEEMDVSGFIHADDETIFRALTEFLMTQTEPE